MKENNINSEDPIKQMIGEQYKDTNNVYHIIEGELSRGGQGVVFKTKDPKILLKFKFNKDENGNLTTPVFDKIEYEQFLEEIKKIKLLDLPGDLPIAKPEIALGESNCGYLMKMIEDMMPLSELSEIKEKNITEPFIESGGLKKRLLIFMKIAKIFITLQSRGVIYADLSFNNIFISAGKENSVVWLIDADNMRYSLDSIENIYTQSIGAPEVVTGQSANTLFSDRFSFAVLLFYTLTLSHPMVGNMVENPGMSDNMGDEEDAWEEDDWDDEDGEDLDSEEDDWDSESDESEAGQEDNGRYERAYRGEFPWVGDIEDSSNCQCDGIPMEYVINKELKELFQKTFGREGISLPVERPDFTQWYKALKKAYDSLIECPECHSTYYAHQKRCPFCNQEKDFPYYKVNILDSIHIKNLFLDMEIPDMSPEENKKNEFINEMVCTKYFIPSQTPQYLYRYHTDITTLDKELEKTIEFVFHPDGVIKIKNLDNTREIYVKNEEWYLVEPSQSIEVNIDQISTSMCRVDININEKCVRHIVIARGE